MKRVTQSVLSLAILMMASSVMAQGLTGYYQSLGLSGGSTSNVGLSTYGSSNTYTPNYSNYNFTNPTTNYSNVGSNTFSTNYSNTGGTGGLSAYYANNGITTSPGNSTTSGGFTQYFGQNLQANTFTRSCPVDNMPDPSTCQGGQYQRITDNYGCTVEWRCEGGQFCPVVERPNTQCNGVWEPQYSASTQCLTHYFCDRTPDEPTYCPAVMDPVCGHLNGRQMTYNNRCLLEAAGARFLYEGQCSTYPDPDVRPVINRFNGPSALTVGETGTWSVTARGGSDSQLTYSIDWGDTYDYAANQAAMQRPSQQTTFTHQYTRAGTYTVRVTVRNEQGQSATATSTVRVEEQVSVKPSINSFTGPNTLEVGETGSWRVSATHPVGEAVEFSIDWGTSQPIYNQNRQIGPSYEQTFQNAYDRVGTYKVTVTARSGSTSVSRTLTVRVVDSVPVGDLAPVVHGITGPTSLNVDQTGTWRVRASDPQNQDLRYQINWGDRYQYGAQARYSSDAGFVQNSAFTHQYSQPGTYTVSITVRNAAGKTARTTTTVRVNSGYPRPYEPWLEVEEEEEEMYQPVYDRYQPSYTNNNYNYYNRYQGNGNRHSFFNRSYNWR